VNGAASEPTINAAAMVKSRANITHRDRESSNLISIYATRRED
jgi:hypothetical protein